jgi:NADPH:quinone reductase-like Zn-dependent oxidoreductase
MPKIVRFHEVGDASVLKLGELPKPQPKEGEVLLKVKAIGLNRAEVMFRSGQYLVGESCRTRRDDHGIRRISLRADSLPLVRGSEQMAHHPRVHTFRNQCGSTTSRSRQKFVTDKLTDGTFKPLIAKTFKLDEIVQAHRYMESNEQIGKIVVTV